jgi:hypothetical protein
VSCPLHPAAVCPLKTLRQVVAKRGEVTLREGDLGGRLAGFSQHDDVSAALDYRLTDEMWRATVDHECRHLLHGPVPRDPQLIRADEARVRRETADALVPMGAALALIDRVWTAEEMREFAARHGVPVAVVADALRPQAEPLTLIPRPRAEDAA